MSLLMITNIVWNNHYPEIRMMPSVLALSVPNNLSETERGLKIKGFFDEICKEYGDTVRTYDIKEVEFADLLRFSKADGERRYVAKGDKGFALTSNVNEAYVFTDEVEAAETYNEYWSYGYDGGFVPLKEEQRLYGKLDSLKSSIISVDKATYERNKSEEEMKFKKADEFRDCFDNAENNYLFRRIAQMLELAEEVRARTGDFTVKTDDVLLSYSDTSKRFKIEDLKFNPSFDSNHYNKPNGSEDFQISSYLTEDAYILNVTRSEYSENHSIHNSGFGVKFSLDFFPLEDLSKNLSDTVAETQILEAMKQNLEHLEDTFDMLEDDFCRIAKERLEKKEKEIKGTLRKIEKE